MKWVKKFVVSACVLSGLLFWMALTPQQIAVNSAIFSGYSDQQLQQAHVYLIAQLAGVAISSANILSNSAPFQSYSDRQLQEAQTYLLSQISTTGGVASNLWWLISGTNIVATTNGNSTLITVNATTDTNVVNILIAAGAGTGFPGTNVLMAWGSAQHTNNVSETLGGLIETNITGGAVALSNGTVTATGPSGVNGSLTLNDSAGGLENTFTNGSAWHKNGITSAGATNTALAASQFITTDASKGQASTLSGATLTNLTYQYTTNAIPALTLSWGRAYETNIAANWTAVLAAPAATFYESIILMVTNSSASDFKVTMPSGVWGTPGSGTPPAYYCTNKMLTKIVIEHYGQQMTNSSKVDYAP